MKEKIITTLKKNILIVELPGGTQFDILINNPLWKDGIKFLTGTEEKFHFIEGSYTLLGKPDEIREEDAKDLVEIKDKMEREIGKPILFYKNYKDESEYYFRSVLSLLSLLESEVYWDVNPLGDEPSDEIGCECEECQEGFEIKYKDFMIAQEKTFDRSRSIILVKQ